MDGDFIDEAVERILGVRGELCNAPINPYNPRASEYELERQLQQTAAQLLPSHLRGLAQHITESSLERYIGSPSPAVDTLFPDANHKSMPIQVSEGDAFEIMLAAYQLAVIHDGPGVVLIHAANSGNRMLATLAGLVLIEERKKQSSPMDRMQYAALLGLSAETSLGSGTSDPRICSEYLIAGVGLR